MGSFFVNRDKDGKFVKCKARFVLKALQHEQKLDQQTDSPTSTRPGFRMTCQFAANKGWDLFHIDVKTAFLQGESYAVSRMWYASFHQERDTHLILEHVLSDLPTVSTMLPDDGGTGWIHHCAVMAWLQYELIDVVMLFILKLQLKVEGQLAHNFSLTFLSK